MPRPRKHLFTMAILTAVFAGFAGRGDAQTKSPWQGETLPLPLSVRTPSDLSVKRVAEKQYLIFNLLAGGKMAWDQGDFASAADKWEALLQIPGLDPDVSTVIRPMAQKARAQAGVPGPSSQTPVTAAAPKSEPEPETKVSISGVVSGGGSKGPGGAVLWLTRTDGRTPRPAPARGRVMNQVNKTFVPRILPVPVGTKVEFKNQDPIFHNVFSLSRPNDFDSGLFKEGAGYSRTFNAPGAVQILCNIHATMIGYVVVLATPYYAQASESGAFTIKGVPAGAYILETWHEAAASTTKTKISVGKEDVRGLAIKVAGNRRSPTNVPDKYGKPRQVQLGY